MKQEKSKSNIPYGTSLSTERRMAMNDKFYLKEFQLFDGENTVIFNIVAIQSEKIAVAITKDGKITVSEYDLLEDENGVYFEYGVAGSTHIHIDDFE